MFTFHTSAIVGFSQVMLVQIGVAQVVTQVLIYTLPLNQEERRVPLKNCYPSTVDVGACLTFITIGHEHKGFSLLEPAVFISSSVVGQISSLIELFILGWQVLR